MATKTDKEKDKLGIGAKIPSLICKDFVLYGEISTTAIRVEGTIVGNILDAENVVVGMTGVIQGNVNAKTLVLFGHIEGDVLISDSVAIKSSGRMNGKLTTISLTVEKGAVYEGSVVMIPPSS